MAEAELYIRVKLGLRDSDGARVLERRLEDPRAYTYVPDLWDWFARLHPEGQVVGPEAAFLIARGAGWLADADKFCAAMVAAEFLALIPEGFRVRGWKKWAGFHYEVRAKERAKKRRQRGPSQGQTPGRPEGQAGDVPGTSTGTSPDIDGDKAASEASCPGDPFTLSDLKSPVVAARGVQGGRARLVSPYGDADPYPNTTTVLAALFARGIADAAPPSAKSAARVEACIEAAGVDVAVERFAEILADPEAERPLTYHVGSLRAPAKPKPKRGDLGVEYDRWQDRLTPEERAAGAREVAELHPDFADAPFGVTGDPAVHPVAEIAAIHAKYRAIVEARA